MSSTRTSLRSARALSESGAGIAVAMAVMNVATYGYTMVAARVLGPQPFGAFAAMMNLLIVVSVISLGLQTTAARRIAANPEQVVQIEREILRVTTRVAALLGIALTLLAPLINRLLQLDSLPTAALLGLAAAPATIMGAQAGVLQGERRWAPLGLLYVAAGVPRLFVGTGLVIWRPSEFIAVLGVVIAAWAPVLVGWRALRHERKRQHLSGDAHSGATIVREVLHNSQAFLAFFALSNVDLVVARNVLSNHDAGLYAAGLILTKAVLFLPQFVVVVAFPSLSTAHDRRRALVRGLALTVAMGGLATIATLALSGLALIFVGGDAYSDVQAQLWMWALLGTLLAMLQLVVYALLAAQHQRSVYVIWLALAIVVILGLTTSSIDGLLSVVLAVDLFLIPCLIAVSAAGGSRSGKSRSQRAR